MTSNFSLLQVPKGATRRKKRVGRGSGSGSGKTAGRGSKGQKARSSGLPGPYLGFEGGQVPLYRRVATRGFSNARHAVSFTVVNLSALQRVYSDGDLVSWDTLVKKSLIKKSERFVRILAKGSLSKKLNVSRELYLSGVAKIGIEKVGGSII